jgi:hypothetical protein
LYGSAGEAGDRSSESGGTGHYGDEKPFEATTADVGALVRANYVKLVSVIDASYANNYLASLFKNATRRAAVVWTCRAL